MFAVLVRKHKDRPDMPVTHINSSHTPALKGWEGVEYQERKRHKTTNSLYLYDRQGLSLAMSEPQKGNHADLYEIEQRVDELAAQLRESGLRTDGLFSNADARFDARFFRLALENHEIIANVCPNPRNGEPVEDYRFYDELYKERFVIERTNARMDGFRSILARFDTTISSWKGWNYLAFAGVFFKKFTNHKSLNEFIIKF